MGPSRLKLESVTTISEGTYVHPTELEVRSFTYKTVNGLSIKADVRRPDDGVPRPAVMWIHGGALMVGCREWLDGHIKNPLLRAGYVFISIDYRLAPESRLPDIIEDVEDAYKWILAEGPGLFGVDPSGLAVLGSSAGGYLALTTGYRCEPRPAALVSFFGYGDLVGSWLTSPSPHPGHDGSPMSEQEIAAVTNGPPVSDDRDREGDGGSFYLHCRRCGTHGRAISGWDPVAEPEAFHPFMPVVNVGADYSPTLLIHGTSDTDVPFEQSALMAEALARSGVEHELIPIEGGEHGLEGGQPDQIEAAYQRAVHFIESHVPTCPTMCARRDSTRGAAARCGTST